MACSLTETDVHRCFQQACGDTPGGHRGLEAEKEEENRQWILRVRQGKELPATLRSLATSDDDLRIFLKILRRKKRKETNKVLTILADRRGVPRLRYFPSSAPLAEYRIRIL